MDELIRDIPLFTAFLFFIVAIRMILLAEQYKMPVFNYLNFSNLLTTSFDIIRGLLYYVAPIIAFLIWKKWIIGLIRDWPDLVFVIALAVCGVFFCLGYWTKNMTFKRNVTVKYLFELIILLSGILIHNFCKAADFQIVKLALGTLFLYVYMKINGKYEVFKTRETAAKREIVIVFKNGFNGRRTLIVDGTFTNTMEFDFVQNATNKEFLVIPMSEIRSIHYKEK